MGGEFGQWTEWNHDAELDWELFGQEYHDGLRRFVGDLNRIYRDYPALYEVDFASEGFRWIQADDSQNSVFAYLRMATNSDDFLTVVCNFTPVAREDYRIGVPRSGAYVEILNSDAAIYGGEDVGNGGEITSEPTPSHGFDHSLSLTLPPLGIVLLKPV